MTEALPPRRGVRPADVGGRRRSRICQEAGDAALGAPEDEPGGGAVTAAERADAQAMVAGQPGHPPTQAGASCRTREGASARRRRARSRAAGVEDDARERAQRPRQSGRGVLEDRADAMVGTIVIAMRWN